MKIKTKSLVYYSFFAALTAILSQISIPLPFTPVPINLATLSVITAGALLGKKGGAISQIVYLFLGAIGLPVYSNFSSGIGVLVGPTGGYLVGYVIAAFVVGLICENSKDTLVIKIISMSLGIISCYTIGTSWYMLITGTGMIEALLACVVPFILGDIVKISVAATLATRYYSQLTYVPQRKK